MDEVFLCVDRKNSSPMVSPKHAFHCAILIKRAQDAVDYGGDMSFIHDVINAVLLRELDVKQAATDMDAYQKALLAGIDEEIRAAQAALQAKMKPVLRVVGGTA